MVFKALLLLLVGTVAGFLNGGRGILPHPAHAYLHRPPTYSGKQQQQGSHLHAKHHGRKEIPRIQGKVNYLWGAVLGMGNVTGAYLATVTVIHKEGQQICPKGGLCGDNDHGHQTAAKLKYNRKRGCTAALPIFHPQSD